MIVAEVCVGVGAAADLEPMLGAKGHVLLDESFDGDVLPNAWHITAGGLHIAEGVLRASQDKAAERLGLFGRELPMQDAAIEIDFKFEGAQGLNISCNPSPGELNKKGHLFSVMITPRMWNITEHNNKLDRNSSSQVLASAMESFEQGKWYRLLLECVGDNVVAHVEGKKALRATSKDFHVKKPGIEFRVLGRNRTEVSFDNLRVWELKPTAIAEEAPMDGQRVFVCGHSFHMPVATMLPEIELAAGIRDRKSIGQQRMGGSTVTQHWNLADDQNMLKKALMAGEVDVVTLSPTAQLPDEGIDKFTELAMQHNPRVRILVQASWAGWDSPRTNPRTFKNEQRDQAKADDLRKDYDPFYKVMCDQTRKLNDTYRNQSERQVVSIVPVAYALIALRDKVSEGKAPGIEKRSELFRDDRGHGKPVIYLLASYCNFAVIYGRSPVGLPAPASLKKDIKAEEVEKLNRLLQEIAWETVTSEPLTGLKQSAKSP